MLSANIRTGFFGNLLGVGKINILEPANSGNGRSNAFEFSKTLTPGWTDKILDRLFSTKRQEAKNLMKLCIESPHSDAGFEAIRMLHASSLLADDSEIRIDMKFALDPDRSGPARMHYELFHIDQGNTRQDIVDIWRHCGPSAPAPPAVPAAAAVSTTVTTAAPSRTVAPIVASPPALLIATSGKTASIVISPNPTPIATAPKVTEREGASPFKNANGQVRQFLSALKGRGEPFRIKAWDQLSVSEKRDWRDEEDYREVQSLMAGQSSDQATLDCLRQHGFEVIRNDGGGQNDCFLISWLQHVKNDYSSGHPKEVRPYRNKLGVTKFATQMTCLSPEAKLFMDLVKRDYPKETRNLRVHVFTLTDNMVFCDTLGKPEREDAQDDDVREVLIWDRGGHFEAVVPSGAGAGR